MRQPVVDRGSFESEAKEDIPVSFGPEKGPNRSLHQERKGKKKKKGEAGPTYGKKETKEMTATEGSEGLKVGPVRA